MNAAATTKNHCLRCGRTLHTPKSIAAGYGPTCAAKVRAAARTADLDGYKPHQINSARELIEDGAIVALPDRVFAAVSSDGTGTYISDCHGCTCPAGDAGRSCYHQLAARLLLAA